MKNKQIKILKFLRSIGAFSLIMVSNNADLKARYLIDNRNYDNFRSLELKDSNINEFFRIENQLSSSFTNLDSENYLIANNESTTNNSNVLISEIIIEGWEDHPEGRKLELAAYEAMSIKPGSVVNNEILKKDLNSIYLSGWFSGVKIKSEEGPLGVKLIVNVIPNPILKEIQITPEETIISDEIINDMFDKYYGVTLNLNVLQTKIDQLKIWYQEKGYSLARINSPDRISDDGVVTLKIDEGIVSEIKLRFIGTDEKVRQGKTKEWVIRRELQTKAGEIFNRKTLENDISRLYSTSLFNDVKVSLGPDELNPGQVIITLDISEQRTGSLTGGLGFSNTSGIFAQIGLQESNALGRAWSTNVNLNFGEYSTTYNFSLYDPWIKGDKNKTSFRTNIFLSRSYPREFRSEDNGKLYGVKDFYKASGTSTATEITQNNPAFTSVSSAKSSDSTSSWFEYGGNSVVLENIGGGFSFARPLNGGDPFKRSLWRVQAGMNFKKVKLIDSSGNSRPFAVTNSSTPTTANVNEIICIGYTAQDGSCPSENTLISFIASASRNNLNNLMNPTSGDVFRIGTEQFISFGDNSPTFNRLRASYAWFIPVDLINLTEGCKLENSDNNSCPQTIGFQIKGGTIIGDLPPYEAFCMGGSSSVRGWGSCDLAVSRSFLELSAEYRFPVWKMVSGSLFADAGSDLGSQEDVPGNPGTLLSKSGSGYSIGAGISIKTPVGPLRLDAASQDLSGNMRYTLGVGWKF